MPPKRKIAEEKSSGSGKARVEKRVKTVDLNELRLSPSVAIGWKGQTSFSNVPRISIMFTSLTDVLVKAISNAEQVVGCTAWLTNDRILKALAKKSGVSFIIQNDDLGYKVGGKGGGRFQTTEDCKRWSTRIESDYAELQGIYITKEEEGEQKSGPVASFLANSFFSDAKSVRATTRCSNAERAWLASTLQNDTVEGRKMIENGDLLVIDSVRALGVRATQANGGHAARMHHKFFVFFDKIGPCAVFTGSFNPTGFAEESLENAVLIECREVAKQYALEHAQLLLQSTPLSWAKESLWGCRTESFTL